jgi:hypothetical protein
MCMQCYHHGEHTRHAYTGVSECMHALIRAHYTSECMHALMRAQSTLKRFRTLCAALLRDVNLRPAPTPCTLYPTPNTQHPTLHPLRALHPPAEAPAPRGERNPKPETLDLSPSSGDTCSTRRAQP